ncbi:basic blue protein-like [Andrographis paniculata]|uniref:basic blue protein-like n=1 Tax=Andrographis paniculata TaxID=175694 RepID=UPI0021E8EFD5|nr:basic blue protein-like [Andrographis paniculata]
MSEGRGSALVFGLAAVMVAAIVAGHFPAAEAATYTVGGARGWTFNVASWPNGKRFRAGDILVFSYSPLAHNVVQVDRRGYNGCAAPSGARILRTGKDQIKLAKGQNFFICLIPGHCQAGMKIAVNAL